MGVGYNPKIVTDGLVLALDVANPKSYDNTENLINNSEFGYTQQSGNTTATPNQLFVPYGRLSAVNFVNNGGSGNTYVYRNFNTSFTVGTQYVISIFSNSSTINFDQGGLAAGKYTLLNSGSIGFGNNWWRHWRLYSATVDNPNVTPQVTLFEGQNITLSGWQAEVSQTVGPYYRTEASTKIRGTTWNDLSGNGNNGTLVNGPTYIGVNNGGFVFDGVDDYIVSPVTSNLSSMSVSFWVYLDPTINWSSRFDIMSGSINPGVNGRYLFYMLNSTTLQYFIVFPSTTSYTVNLTNANTLFTGKWNNVVMTTNTVGTETTMTLYRNGEIVNSTIVPEAATAVNSSVYFMRNQGNQFPTKGILSNTKVYNRALSAQEIQQNFNAIRGRFGL
jgi:hypothetical protein